jgi:hypothetical protein
MHASLSAAERRIEVRMPTFEPAVVAAIVDGDVRVWHGTLVDIGPGGAGVELDEPDGGPPRGAELVVVLDERRCRRVGRVVGRTGRTVHVAFLANVVGEAAG